MSLNKQKKVGQSPQLEMDLNCDSETITCWKINSLIIDLLFNAITAIKRGFLFYSWRNQAVLFLILIWQHFAVQESPVMIVSPTSVQKYCLTVTYWPLLSTSKHTNGTASVDNQNNTNILYTIKYKRAEVQHESNHRQKNQNGAKQ